MGELCGRFERPLHEAVKVKSVVAGRPQHFRGFRAIVQPKRASQWEWNKTESVVGYLMTLCEDSSLSFLASLRYILICLIKK